MKKQKNNAYNYDIYKFVELDYCRICNEEETKKLSRHHIKTCKDYPNLINFQENIMVLCKKCHRLIHSKKKISIRNIWKIKKYNKLLREEYLEIENMIKKKKENKVIKKRIKNE